MTDAANTTPTPQPSPGAPTPSPSLAPAPDGGSPTTISRPEYVPETFWDPATNSVKTQEFTTHIGELAALKAQQDARLAARPEKPDGYKLELPQTFKTDVALKFEETDPRIARLRAFGHQRNWSQEDFAEALTIEAEHKVAEHKRESAERDAEIAKLGPNSTARVTATKTWLTSLVGEKRANGLLGLLLEADHFEAFEEMQRKYSSQGGADYSNGGRENKPAPDIPFAQKLWPKRQVA